MKRKIISNLVVHSKGGKDFKERVYEATKTNIVLFYSNLDLILKIKYGSRVAGVRAFKAKGFKSSSDYIYRCKTGRVRDTNFVTMMKWSDLIGYNVLELISKDLQKDKTFRLEIK